MKIEILNGEQVKTLSNTNVIKNPRLRIGDCTYPARQIKNLMNLLKKFDPWVYTDEKNNLVIKWEQGEAKFYPFDLRSNR